MTQLVRYSIPSATTTNAQLHTNALNDSRILLADQRTPYRYEDTELLLYLNEFYDEVARLRPDLIQTLIRDPLNPFPPYYQSLEELATTTFLIQPRYYPALAAYIAGRCSARDDEFQTSGRAQAFIDHSKKIIIGAA